MYRSLRSAAAVLNSFFVVLSLLRGVGCQHKLTNIDVLGDGYDLVRGNPQSDLYDPGFRQSVFQLDYNSRTTSSDGKWLLPDQVEAMQTVGCSYDAEVTEIMGDTSYQNSLLADVRVHVNIGKRMAFRASSGFREIHEGTYKYHRSYVSSVSKCAVYVARIKQLSNINVTKNFADAVAALPPHRDDSRYVPFMSAFGTHYVSLITMGSKATLTSEFEQTTRSSLDAEKFEFSSAARASFLVFTGSYRTVTEKEGKMQKKYDEKRRAVKRSYLGSRPSGDGKWETWAKTSGESPYPIAYDLRPLAELFASAYFPTVDVATLNKKKTVLEEVMDSYCNYVTDCRLPVPDRVPVRVDATESKIIGRQLVSCRPGYSLLSCGIRNSPSGGGGGKKRYAVAVGSSGCECSDDDGAQCVVWCANAIRAAGYRVTSSPARRGWLQATCPRGAKVMSCTIVPQSKAGDPWRMHYPTDDGASCKCYESQGGHCYATCSSNIRNHEVRSQYGVGNVTVACSTDNFVLGCGMQPIRTASTPVADQTREFYVSSLNSCTCKDQYGATCYALCGQFI